MKFDRLAYFLKKIESTRKRLEIHEILCDLFREIKKNDHDVKKVIYILQGQLDSNIEGTKFGIAEKTLLQSISQTIGKKYDFVEEKYRKSGEIGDFVYNITKKYKKNVNTNIMSFMNVTKDVTIDSLFSQLQKLSEISGSGSNKKKINLISGIFNITSPTSSKYITNIILGKMRIGVGEPSIMDALSEVFLGDKTLRSFIESKYNIFPDLGEIGEMCVKGKRELEKIGITVGIPIRMMLAKRLPYDQISDKLGGEFIAEYKYDGERIQVHKNGECVNLFSRHLKNISHQYPDVVRSIKENIEKENVIIEGECVAMDEKFTQMLPFQVVSIRRRKYDIEKAQKKVPVCLFVFDVLYCNGENYMNRPYSERLNKIQEIIPKSNGIQPSHYKKIVSTKEMMSYFEQARKNGAEGIMNKDIRENSFYEAGNRGFKWIKLKGIEGSKMHDSIDGVIIGANYGKGKRGGIYGTFLIAVYNDFHENFEYLTKCGSGFSDADLEMMGNLMKNYIIPVKDKFVECNDKADVWFKPEIIVEVVGDELTKSEKSSAGWNGEYGYSLRFPIYQRIRNDKGIFDITTSHEIEDLYIHQQ